MNGVVWKLGLVSTTLTMLFGCTPPEVTVEPDPDCACPPTGQGSSSSSATSGGGGMGGSTDTGTPRLRRVLLTSSETASPEPMALRYFDTMRGEECTFTELPGGEWRCLPRFAWLKTGWFSDAACTLPIATLDACDNPPNYVRDTTAQPWGACNPKPLEALFELGPTLPPDQVVFSFADAECKPQPNAGGTPNLHRPLGASVSLDAFVSATLVTE